MHGLGTKTNYNWIKVKSANVGSLHDLNTVELPNNTALGVGNEMRVKLGDLTHSPLDIYRASLGAFSLFEHGLPELPGRSIQVITSVLFMELHITT